MLAVYHVLRARTGGRGPARGVHAEGGDGTEEVARRAREEGRTLRDIHDARAEVGDAWRATLGGKDRENTGQTI